MPQRPALRHVLGKIRLECQLNQPQLGKLLGVAPITVQKIEQGRLGLSEDLAGKAESELDVAAAWLLANDPKTPPVTPRGGKWSKDFFEFAQGSRFFLLEKGKRGNRYRINTGLAPEGAANEFTAYLAADYSAQIHAMLEGCKASPRQGVLVHRLKQMLESLAEDFRPDKATLNQYAPKIAKLEKAFDRKSKQIAQEETERLWADPAPQPKPF
jgi:transcriptional regulator with XRE-family HTH domain